MSDDRLDLIRSRFHAAEDVAPAEGQPAPSEPEGPDPALPEEEASTLPMEATAATFPLNDIGNGRRFALYYEDEALRVSRVGWFRWTGQVWKKDDADMRDFSPLVRQLAHAVSERMEEETAHIPIDDWARRLIGQEEALERRRVELEGAEGGGDELAEIRAKLNRVAQAHKAVRDRKAEYRRFAKSTGNSSKIDAMLKEAAVSLSRPLEAMDAKTLDVNCESGVLSFWVDPGGEGASRSAVVHHRPHERADLMTKMMPVEFDETAASPRFDAFLNRIQPDPAMRAFIQRWCGLSLTSITGDQKLAFFYGQGANGKSVLVDLIARIMGDYAATAKIESLTGTNRRGGGDATPDLIPLMGARMDRASELEQGTHLQEGVIKELTGGEPILVRALHSDFVEVKPQFKLTISGSHRPDIRGTDDGIWRRVMLVPFDVMIPEAERDPNLGERLFEEERSGILNWMVAGLIDYLEGGLQVPQDVVDATAGYREDSDPIGVFLADCCEVTGSEQDFTTSKLLVEAFNFWMDERGEGEWRPRTITLKLKERAKRHRDPRTGKSFSPLKRSISGYVGIKLSDMFRKRFEASGRASLQGTAGSSSQASSSSPDPF